MARIGVFLPDEQLKACDTLAKREGVRRSELIQRALAGYMERLDRQREEAQRRAQRVEACRRMDELAEKAGSWDPVAVIRSMRDARYGTDWWKTRTHALLPAATRSKRRRR